MCDIRTLVNLQGLCIFTLQVSGSRLYWSWRHLLPGYIWGVCCTGNIVNTCRSYLHYACTYTCYMYGIHRAVHAHSCPPYSWGFACAFTVRSITLCVCPLWSQVSTMLPVVFSSAHRGYIYSLSWSHDSHMISTASADGLVKYVHVHTLIQCTYIL